MNYAKIKFVDIANGPGCRVSLWVCGCPIHCPQCFNSELWNKDYGRKFDHNTLDAIINALNQDHITGFSLLGGEPLSAENFLTNLHLCKIIKSRLPEKSIIIYSGYEMNEIKSSYMAQIFDYCDYLVTGPFDHTKKIVDQFRGSSNQEYWKSTKDGLLKVDDLES